MGLKEKLKKYKKNENGIPILTSEEALKIMGKLVCQICGNKLKAKNNLGIYCPTCSKGV